VNCIHYVEREDLATLEYLIRPQQKPGVGVYGGGWERPKNVFMAARTFKRQMEEKKARASGAGLLHLLYCPWVERSIACKCMKFAKGLCY